MSTLRELLKDHALKSLAATTVLSATSPSEQITHREVTGKLVHRYCSRLVNSLNEEDVFDADNKTALLRNVDRTLVALAHFRDQVDPPAVIDARVKGNAPLVAEYLDSINETNRRRHDLLIEQQYGYMTDYMEERNSDKYNI